VNIFSLNMLNLWNKNNKIKQFGFVVFLLLLFASQTHAQTIISGNITDHQNNALKNINVLIYPKNSTSILAFAMTNADGFYKISLKQELDTFELSVNSLNYSKESVSLPNKTQTYNFTLKAQKNEIKEIIVKEKPITQNGDTINYLVSAFSTEKDRVIADVLENMPGIEVSSSGQVKYQGKPIEKYYIEGLDLLEGQYGIANKNLPYQDVGSVQILENHQPIKTLENVISSNNVSLNIKLKKKVTKTGTAHTALGFTPLLWDINFTPMFFSKRQQMITSYQTNNTGNDVSESLKSLSLEELYKLIENNGFKSEFLNIQNSYLPQFPKDKYLQNKIHLLTTNYLLKLNNDLQLRVNLSYFNDFQTQCKEQISTYFLPNDTISFTENFNNELLFNTLESKLTLYQNKKESYFKNQFQTKSFWDSQTNYLNLSNENIQQNISNPYHSFSNEFKFMRPFGKQIITFYSILSKNLAMQELGITSGVFNAIFNDSLKYENLNQVVNYNSFSTNNYASMGKAFKIIHATFKTGFQYHNEKYTTFLYKNLSPENEINSEEYRNNMHKESFKFYSEVKIQLKKRKFTFDANTPLNLYSLSTNYSNSEKKQYFYTNPNSTLLFDYSPKLRFTTSVGYNETFDEIVNQHTAYILKSYNNLEKKNTPPEHNKSYNSSIDFNYKNPVKSFFVNGGYSFSFSKQNLIFHSEIDENGFIVLNGLEKNNNSITNSYFLKLSQYFSSIKTSASLNLMYSTQSFSSYVNLFISDTKSKNIEISPRFNVKLSEKLRISIKPSIYFYTATITDNKTINFSQIKGSYEVFYQPITKHYCSFYMNYYSTFQNTETVNDYFFDFKYRYRWEKKGVDFEAKFINILNHTEFSTFQISELYQNYTTYQLRPFQILLTVKFSFN